MVSNKNFADNFSQSSNLVTTPARAGSLTRKTLLQITAGVATAIVASTAISYFQVMNTLKAQTLEQLEKYVVERGQRENTIFTLAEDNHALLKQELVRRLETTSNSDPKVQFDKLFVKSKDGVIRNRPESFDGKRQPGVYIDKSLKINADIRRRVLAFYDLVKPYGAAWHNRFQDTYITTPENIMVMYWPEVPTWTQDAAADLYMPNEEYVWVADKKHNPARETAWTGVYYDKVAKSWMVSAETPVDVDGRHVATIGHDVLLTELLQRTVNDHIKGAYNLIFREDGRAIAHPKLYHF
ncbi:MAG: hypothetical protein KME08_14270 [Aphanothece sp. CMT-3BRIN-NPC111]|jgi:hypothetical protein|nr:hypothetical protein [Aphanothece sp. CMT-3BRIN-NPC111]